jgi:hypothetical protein
MDKLTKDFEASERVKSPHCLTPEQKKAYEVRERGKQARSVV